MKKQKKNINPDIHIKKAFSVTTKYLEDSCIGHPLKEFDHLHTEMLMDELIDDKDILKPFKKEANMKNFKEECFGFRSKTGTFPLEYPQKNYMNVFEEGMIDFFWNKNMEIVEFKKHLLTTNYFYKNINHIQQINVFTISAEHKKFYVSKLFAVSDIHNSFYEFYKDEFPYAEIDQSILQVVINIYYKQEFFS